MNFASFILSHDPLETDLKRRIYTWSNMLEDLVMAKLDKFLYDLQWKPFTILLSHPIGLRLHKRALKDFLLDLKNDGLKKMTLIE